MIKLATEKYCFRYLARPVSNYIAFVIMIFRLLSCIWVWVRMLTAENLLNGFDDAPKFYNIVFTGGYDKRLRESKLFRGC